MIRHQEFDVSEMTLASYTVQRARGESPYIGIPVFLARTFVHAGLFVTPAPAFANRRIARQARRIRAIPDDLRELGARLLQNDYGIDLSKIEWRTGRPEAPLNLPPQMKVSLLPESKLLLPDRSKSVSSMR